ncbi:hypothetical protein ACSBR1_040969 [Camellia fascicularis]
MGVGREFLTLFSSHYLPTLSTFVSFFRSTSYFSAGNVAQFQTVEFIFLKSNKVQIIQSSLYFSILSRTC